MKKKNTIWIFLIVLVIALTGLYLSRNRWAGYLLKREVSTLSHGNISLTFSSIHLGIFSKHLTVLNPSLTYKNTFINSSHSLKLVATKFKKISVYDLFLWNFLMKGEYVCKEFMVAQPTFQLASGDSVKPEVQFNPSAWIKVIQKHRLPAIPVKFKIKHASVKLGKIRLGKSKKTGEFGGADYEISIEDLGNINDSISSDAVTYKNLKINIHNVFRSSKQGNFSLKIDTISYTSSLQEFTLSGLQYHSLRKEKNQNMNIFVKWAQINGLMPDTATKTFHIRAVRWSGGSITFPVGKLAQLFSRHQPNKHLEVMVKNFPYLEFDTLHLDKVHVSRIAQNNDTVFSIKKLNLNILNAKISRKTFNEPLRAITFSSLKSIMTRIYYLNPKNGDKIISKKVLYESGKKMINALDLKYEKICLSDNKPIWMLSSKQVNVGNFSGKRFHKKELQNISVQLLNPDIRFWENRACQIPNNESFSKEIGRINFTSLNLEKGSLRFYSKKHETLKVSGFDLLAKNLMEKSDSGRKFISYDTLYFQAATSAFSNPGNALQMKSGTIQLLGRNLSMDSVKLTSSRNNNLRIISIPFSTFTKIQLNPLIFGKTLTGSQADFYNSNVIIRQFDTLYDNDTVSFTKKQFYQFPLKVSFSNINIDKGHLDLTLVRSADSINLNTGIDLVLNSFKMGYDKEQLISTPSNWTVKLGKTLFRSHQILGKMDSAVMSSQRQDLNIRNMLLASNESTPSKVNFVIKAPLTQMNRIDYAKLLRSDSLTFGKIAFRDAKFHLTVPKQLKASGVLTNWLPETTVIYDSLEMNHSDFTVQRHIKTSDLKIAGNQLDVLYRPLLRALPKDSINKKDFLKKWDISLKTLHLSDTLNNIKIVADGIALQSQFNQLFIKSLSGNNLPPTGSLSGNGKDYAAFKLQEMMFSGLQLRGPDFRKLSISKWTTPAVWLKVIQGTKGTKQVPSTGLIASLVNKNASSGFIKGINIKSANFKKLDFSFLYANQKKQIGIHDVSLAIHDIIIDSTLMSNHPNYLFRDMRFDSHGKSIISGDSMYVFRTKDIRVNLPQKRISLDSITVTPRYKRKAFFKKAKKQTDRVTVYGKSIDFNNFDFATFLKKKVFHVGDVSLNNFNVLFERDKHYPLGDSTRPMPIEILHKIPYKFNADTVKINHSFISYYEYEKKSLNPGIFFINNFNVYFLNVTDDFGTLKSSAVLKVHGSGQMMRTANLHFVLLMPYFSPDNQFWFSAQTSRLDLTQLNSLSQNIVGISIKSGYGNADVQYVSGNNKLAKGNMLFLYKNLKLRLYNRKKAKTSKGMGSPFVNFMLNKLMIRTNNPKFLKPPHKGIVYFERDPRKSFVNYLWKSCFSGITSTLGFNNKFQRKEKKVEKKTEKEEAKAGK